MSVWNSHVRLEGHAGLSKGDREGVELINFQFATPDYMHFSKQCLNLTDKMHQVWIHTCLLESCHRGFLKKIGFSPLVHFLAFSNSIIV